MDQGRRSWGAWLRRLGYQLGQEPEVPYSAQPTIVARDESLLAEFLIGPTGLTGGQGSSAAGGPTRLIVGAGGSGAHVDLLMWFDGAVPEKVWARPGRDIITEQTLFPALPGTGINTEVIWQPTGRPESVGSVRVATDELPALGGPATWGFGDDGFGVPVAFLDKGQGTTPIPSRAFWNYWIEPNCSLYVACEASSVEWGLAVREPGAPPS